MSLRSGTNGRLHLKPIYLVSTGCFRRITVTAEETIQASSGTDEERNAHQEADWSSWEQKTL